MSFDDLPLITLPSYMYPRHDGDMAYLHELADRLFTYPARDVATLADEYVYHRTCQQLGIYPTQILQKLRNLK
jgi:hypothetical protein